MRCMGPLCADKASGLLLYTSYYRILLAITKHADHGCLGATPQACYLESSSERRLIPQALKDTSPPISKLLTLSRDTGLIDSLVENPICFALFHSKVTLTVK